MERSKAIETLVSKVYEAIKRGDAGAVASLIATGSSSRMIGTDPDEWWSGAETVNAALRAQLDDMGGIDLVGGEPEGYSVGTVGWFADRPAFRLADGNQVPVRLTGVVVLEDGSWKLIQAHVSVGVPNEEVVGRELPT